ncbi:RING-H2 finger protein ATL29-like [Camellia sinensis]|uniref:RING-type E3 ubiquitin transferase n=1 Tax=Camellia sinensis var. sinensis TaxID=542762 RepID=A0A4S4F4J6_CAMSN|nr:RING-H2 finger protein ATL29-like [Camellia sinensis]THG23934.1 hypothetical protein TEA_015943 [Camellia sinensis var. sinensis]
MTTSTVESTPQSYTSPPVTIILTIILLVFFFVGFFSVYFCRCFMENLLYSWYINHSPTGTPVGPACPNEGQGLDSSIIQTFPTFTYASVKDLRKEKYGLECAICLSEFADDDILRLLTACCHVFHQECIDLWLASHNTCPVCRRNLDGTEKSPEKSPVHTAMHEINENEALEVEDGFGITVKDEDDNDRHGMGEEGVVAPSTVEFEKSDGQNEVEKFPRSHSTGHSIVRARTWEDRFTLRLPEHLHVKLVRGHNWTGSCTTFGEFKSKTSTGYGGFGEVSDFSGGDVNRV